MARVLVLATLTTVLLCGVLVGFQSGPPSQMTGAPGNSNCTLCHFSFALNSGVGLGIASFDISGPATTLDVPGSGAASIVVGFPATTRPIHGFEMTARDAADMQFNPSFAGSWDTSTFGNDAQFAYGDPEYVSHTLSGSQQTSWSVGWLPDPSPPSGPMTIYAAGNAANGNSAPTSDYIFTATHTVYQARVSVAQTTWPIGSSQPITLEAPTVSGHSYILVASDDATPVSLGGPFLVPLNPFSALANLTLDPAYASIFQNFQGSLDGNGNATAQVNVPPLPNLSGMVAHLAFATLDPLSPSPSVTELSNRVTVTLQ
ncbi:MAG: choice-of-anchor V domain-containing protein [Planctomycetota bacterium]|nr:choice-of-anchor V domain-containing protein [Planctomycetota bacterium]